MKKSANKERIYNTTLKSKNIDKGDIIALLDTDCLDNIINRITKDKTILNCNSIIKKGYLTGEEQFIDLLSNFIYYFRMMLPTIVHNNMCIYNIFKNQEPTILLNKDYYHDNKNEEYNKEFKKLIVRNMYENIKILYANKSSSEIENELNELRFNVEKKEKELISLMTKYVSNEDNKCDFKADVANINKFINLYNEIRDRNLVIFKDKARKAKEECELAFKNDFLYKIRTSINETYENINNLNKILKREENRFGKDKEIYEFVIEGTKDEALKPYYDLFISDEDYDPSNLFSKLIKFAQDVYFTAL